MSDYDLFPTSRCGPAVVIFSSLRYISVALGATSIFACCLIFLGYGRMERRPDAFDTSSCLLFLTICDFILAVMSVLDGADLSCFSRELCWFKACMSQFFCTSGFMWTAVMSHSSYVGVKQLFAAPIQDSQKVMIRYHILCWGLPLLVTSVMVWTSTPTSTGYPCDDSQVGALDREESAIFSASVLLMIFQIGLYVLPLLAAEGFNLFVFRFLINTLRRMPASSELLTRFSKYLAVVLSTRIILLLQKLIYIIAPNTQIYLLLFFAAVGPPLQGLGDYFILQSSRERNRFAQISGTESRSMSTTSDHGMALGHSSPHNHDGGSGTIEIGLQQSISPARPRLLLGGAFEIVGDEDGDDAEQGGDTDDPGTHRTSSVAIVSDTRYDEGGDGPLNRLIDATTSK
jgi:Slime mold cyclic AMP receptor